MPTGYTADLYDGKDVSLPDFIMGCARAFGALIDMRDDPKDAPIPDEFPPGTYYAEAAEKARARLAELEQMSAKARARASEADYNDRLNRWQERRDQAQERRIRYNTMLSEVEGWTPPTADHVGLKEFMREQLESSIKFDCSMDYDDPPVRLDPDEWCTKEMQSAARDLERYLEHDAEERQRAAERTAWVRALRESLPTAAPA